MTPAIRLLEKHGIKFDLLAYQHDPDAPAYGLEAAEKLNLPAAHVFKTLVVSDESNRLYVAIVPVAKQLSMKAMAKAVKVKRITMADKDLVIRSTGYVLGGVSPLGQKKPLPTVLDDSAESLPTIYVSAGRRGLEVALVPSDLLQLTRAVFSSVASDN